MGCGLQERKAAGDHKQSEEKETVTAGERGGPEEESAGSKKSQAGHESRLVSRAAHYKCSGHGQQKISQVKSGLHQTGLEPRYRERLHEMTDQDVIKIVGNAPKKEQDGDQNEWDKVSCGEQSRCRAGIYTRGAIPFRNRQRHRLFGFNTHLHPALTGKHWSSDLYTNGRQSGR